jgi:hypothetical protein
MGRKVIPEMTAEERERFERWKNGPDCSIDEAVDRFLGEPETERKFLASVEAQLRVPGTETGPDPVENGLGWKFKLELTVMDGVGGRDKLTVIQGEAPAERIEELVCGAVHSKRFLRKLRGTVGEPLFAAGGK